MGLYSSLTPLAHLKSGINSMHKFNFSPSFIHWIRILYKDVFSAVMNNGFATGDFPMERGVRQGDPLSPYLFIIAVEILAIKIWEGNNIQGFKIGQEIVKLSSFADDMTCFLKDNSSYSALFETLEFFGECSGLKVNHEKTRIFALGNSTLHKMKTFQSTISVQTLQSSECTLAMM